MPQSNNLPNSTTYASDFDKKPMPRPRAMICCDHRSHGAETRRLDEGCDGCGPGCGCGPCHEAHH
eukprot:357519-Chlamydomonas_euryale.AAC.1